MGMSRRKKRVGLSVPIFYAEQRHKRISTAIPHAISIYYRFRFIMTEIYVNIAEND